MLDFLRQEFRGELEAFDLALSRLDDAAFDRPSPFGHSVRWQVLHVMEWLRLAFGFQTSGFAYLGWENEPWVRVVSGPPALGEITPVGQIRAALVELREQVDGVLKSWGTEDVERPLVFPYGERPRLAALGRQLRHIAYHRGQVALVIKEFHL